MVPRQVLVAFVEHLGQDRQVLHLGITAHLVAVGPDDGRQAPVAGGAHFGVGAGRLEAMLAQESAGSGVCLVGIDVPPVSAPSWRR